MPLDESREAFAFRGAGEGDFFYLIEPLNVHDVANFVLGGILYRELSQEAELLRLLRFFQCFKTKDYRRISIFVYRLDLRHRGRCAVEEGDRDHTTIVFEDS